MLGVATMVVVNSVMEGFTSEMQNRIHGIISDVVLESRSLNGMLGADLHMSEISRIAGDSIEAMTPTVAVPALLNYKVNNRDQWIPRPVQLIGIDENTQGKVSDFSKYLQHPSNRKKPSFDLHEDGYDVRDNQAGTDAPERPQMAAAGKKHRREMVRIKLFNDKNYQLEKQEAPAFQNSATPDQHGEKGESEAGATTNIQSAQGLPGSTALAEPTASPSPITESYAENAAGDNKEDAAAGSTPSPGPNAPTVDPFANRSSISNPSASSSDPLAAPNAQEEFDMAAQQHTGIVLGMAMSSIRMLKDKEDPRAGFEDNFLLLPGDDVIITSFTVGTPPKFISDNFTIVDFYESKMSEYDSNLIFMPIRKLQELRGMIDPTSGEGLVNSIQIKLKPGAKGEEVRDKLKAAFPPELYAVETWRDKQGPLLAAVQTETSILNVLLFFIIAVAGFGILAIFYMIVVEKTRDIGILKSLGAPGRGVMGIFLAYGLALGLVGSGVGLAIGLIFVRNINEIADLLSKITGQPVFDPTIYYFYKIPTIIVPQTIGAIMIGAVVIAVAASILPARRAARLHPVEALRYE
jgi:lipoprotein-releasing system permease protein